MRTCQERRTDGRPTGYGCLGVKPLAPLTNILRQGGGAIAISNPSGLHDSQYFRDDIVDAHAGGIDENRIRGRLERRDCP